MAELREVARRQMRFALLANLASAVVIGGTLATLAALALGDRMSLADATAAAAAIVLFGQRLLFGGFGAANLYESALFIRDIASFLDLAPAAGREDNGAVRPLPRALLAVGAARPLRRAPFAVVAREVSFS